MWHIEKCHSLHKIISEYFAVHISPHIQYVSQALCSISQLTTNYQSGYQTPHLKQKQQRDDTDS